MRRTAATALALVCATATTAAGVAPASAGAAAFGGGAGTAGAAQEDTRLSASATGGGVSTVAANARIGAVLPARATSAILGKQFTMTVWDAGAQQYVYKRRGKKSLRGASTTKILTAVGVLANLGPDHRMTTTVRAGSEADEIILVAGGDPLLTSADLRKLARRTVKALTPNDPPEPGGTAAQGTISVRADDSLFRGGGISRGWYSHWVPSQVRRVGAFARDDRKVSDSTADAGAYFAKRLRKLGVDARYTGEEQADAQAATLASIPGHSVGEAVSHMLLVSDNDTAEMLFRQVAVARGVKASWPGARKAMHATLRELRIPLRLVRIVDGSGLSMDGRVSAPALTRALRRALDPSHPELAGIRGWLPVAGRTGTLQAAYLRFTKAPSRCAAGAVQAKTGTLADAISLAGYATGADGATKVFVSIVNARPTRYSRLTTRQAVDRAVSSITGCW